MDKVTVHIKAKARPEKEDELKAFHAAVTFMARKIRDFTRIPDQLIGLEASITTGLLDELRANRVVTDIVTIEVMDVNETTVASTVTES